jgi:diketogulonate reductase-like aldo/keto reductase
LADGNSIPQLGLGVYEMNEKETYESVKWALQAGYKHIDTAEWYVCQRIAVQGLIGEVRE